MEYANDNVFPAVDTLSSSLKLPSYRSSHSIRFHPYPRVNRPLDRLRIVSLHKRSLALSALRFCEADVLNLTILART